MKSDEGQGNVLEGRDIARGTLERVLSLPVDLFDEILYHLAPKDLLQLTRTSKRLRNILSSPRLDLIWRMARANYFYMPIPAPPPGMSEPKFASVLFDFGCRYCPRREPEYIEFHLGVRICRPCLLSASIFTPNATVWQTAKGDEHSHTRNANMRDYAWHIGPVTPHLHEIWELPRRRCYHVETVKAYIEATANMDQNQYKQWFDIKKKEYDSVEEIAVVLRTFYVALEQSWGAHRRDMIEKRLTNLGWGDELSRPQSMRFLQSHELYCKIRPLSDEGWQKVQKVFVDYMTKVKRYRVTGERLKLFESVTCDYLTAQIDVAPPWSTIAQAFPFYDMVFNADVDSDEFTEAAIHAALYSHLPNITAEWLSTVESKLIEKLHENKLSPHLSLAASSFSCLECSNCLHYPQILEHDCLLNASTQTNENEGTYTLGTYLYDSMAAPTKRKVLVADALVRLCGGDPETATATWLDEQNKFFTCGGCWKPDARIGQLSSMVYGRWRFFMSDHKASWCNTHDSSALRIVHESEAVRKAMKIESRADTPAICKICERHFRPGKWDEHLLRHDHLSSGSKNEWREHWHPMNSKEHYHYPSNYCHCDEEKDWDWDSVPETRAW